MTLQRVRITRTTKADLSARDYNACLRLNFGPDEGCMHSTLVLGNGWMPIWLVRPNGHVVAWALLDEDEVANIYVHRSMRRQGIGRQLAEAVRAEFPGMLVRPHDRPSWALLGRYTDIEPHPNDLLHSEEPE